MSYTFSKKTIFFIMRFLCVGLLVSTFSAPPSVSFAQGEESATISTTSVETDFELVPFPANTIWARESLHSIKWKEKSLTDFIGPTRSLADEELATVDVSFDHGNTWENLDVAYANSGSYLYTIPAAGSTQARFRITIRSISHETTDVSFGPSQKQKYAWKLIRTNVPWGGRDGVGGLVYKNKMWVIGGWNPYSPTKSTFNDVWNSTDGIRWTKVKSNTWGTTKFNAKTDWEGRHFAGYQVFDNKMWIIGGDPLNGYYQTDIWNSTDGKKWKRVDKNTVVRKMIVDDVAESATFGKQIAQEGIPPITKTQFGDRTLHITGNFNNKLWIMGGQIIEQFVDREWPGSPGKALNDVWSSKNGADWTKVQTNEPMWKPRGIIDRAVTFQNRMWIIGGGTYDDVGIGHPDRDFDNDVWSTADGVNWTQHEDGAFKPRQYHNVTVFDGKIWVIAGGVPGVGNSNDAWYTSDGKNWYQAETPKNLVGSHAATVWVYKNALYFGLGNTFDTDSKGKQRWRSDIWRVTKTK